MKKRILSFILVMVFCIGVSANIPITISATENSLYWQWPINISKLHINDVAHFAGKYSCHSTGHKGYDMISTTSDWSIKPVADGKVVEVGDMWPYGVFIVMSHDYNGETYYSKYQHLKQDSITVKPNDIITKNKTIATMGNTGESPYGAHLHVELGYQNNGNAVLKRLVALERYLPELNKSCYNDDGLDWDYVNDSSAKKPPDYVEWGVASKEPTKQTKLYFLAKPEAGKTTIPVRESSKSSAKQLYTIEKGVPILTVGFEKNSSGNTWYKTQDGGWIYSERLEPMNSNKSFKSYSAKNMFIVKNNAPIRYSPYQESKKVKTLKHMNMISVIAEFTNARNNKWYMDTEGHWIYSGNISSISPLKGEWMFRNGNGNYLNASTDKDGGNVTVKKGNKSVWQTFKVTAGSAKHSIAVSGSKSGRVVNVYTEGKSAAGKNVTLWSVTKDDTQLWTFEYKNNAYIIHPADNSKLALTAYSDGNVKLSASTGAKEQLWYLVKPSTSTVKTVSTASKYEEGKTAAPLDFDETETGLNNIVAASYNYIYAIQADGNLWAWNNGKSKKLLDDTINVQGGGGYGDYAVKKDGTLWELEYSKAGEDHNKFPSVRKVMNDVSDIGIYSGGMDANGCMGILKKDGSLWASVYNWSSGKQTEPIQVAKGGFVSVTSVGDYLLALKEDKSLWIWEGNYVFNPNDDNTKTICFVKIMDNVKQIGKQNVFTALIIKEDGNLYVWNYAEFTSTDRKVIPKGIKVLDNVGQIFDWSNLATDVKGALWTWNLESDDNMILSYLGNSKVTENVKHAYGTRYSGSALKNDGTLWQWNEMGTPKKQKTGISEIEAGLFYYTYTKEDGSLWAEGYALPGTEYGEKLITKKIFDSVIIPSNDAV